MPPLAVYTRNHPDTTWRSPGRPDVSGAPENPADEFVLIETEATLLNTGAGLLRPIKETAGPVTGGVRTMSKADGVNGVIRDITFNSCVKIVDDAKVENCELLGPPTPFIANNVDLLSFTDGRRPADGSPNVSFTTLRAQAPSPFVNGIGQRNYYAYRCQILDVTDALTIAGASSTGALGSLGVQIEGCYAGRLVPWRPDIANPSTNNPGGRPEGSHLEVVQAHGWALIAALGAKTVSIIGNTLNAHRNRTFFGSVTKPGVGTATVNALGDPAPRPNGITLSTPRYPRIYMHAEGNRFYGGMQSFNGGGGPTGITNQSGGIVAVIDNWFERRNTYFDPADDVDRELVVNSAYYTRTVRGNKYIGDWDRTGPDVPLGNS